MHNAHNTHEPPTNCKQKQATGQPALTDGEAESISVLHSIDRGVARDAVRLVRPVREHCEKSQKREQIEAFERRRWGGCESSSCCSEEREPVHTESQRWERRAEG